MAVQPRPALLDPARRWTGLVLLSALALLFVVDPAVTRIWPQCPFLALTGWLCPLCGSLRAVHAALHGEFLAALQANAFTGVAATAVVAHVALAVIRGKPAGADTLMTWGTGTRVTWILFGIATLLFTVARNVPGDSFGWLRP
jgi:hypothetical protein